MSSAIVTRGVAVIVLTGLSGCTSALPDPAPPEAMARLSIAGKPTITLESSDADAEALPPEMRWRGDDR